MLGQSIFRVSARSIALFMLVFMVGCAAMRPSYEPPEVKLVSLKVLPPDGVETRFLVGLKLLNANDLALDVAGLSYKLRLDGFNLISGVTNDVPMIEAFGEERLEVEVSVNMLNGLRFLNAMMQKEGESIQYELEARLSTRSLFSLPITIIEEGQIDLAR